MKLSEYLLDRIFSLICMLVAALVLLALLWLIETPAVFILFAEVILLAAYSTALLYDFFRKQGFYNLLQKMTEQMDIKTLLGELMVPPHFLEGQILVDVLRCCNKYQNDQLACAEQENREYREYLDSWVHEIKTPITSARLIVENEKNPIFPKLYYASETDYLFFEGDYLPVGYAQAALIFTFIFSGIGTLIWRKQLDDDISKMQKYPRTILFIEAETLLIRLSR